MKKMYPFWVILSLLVFSAAVILAGVGFSLFVRLSSLLIVVFPPLFLALSVFPAKEIGGYFRAAFEKATPSREQLGRAAAFFQAVQSYVMYAGLIGVIVGLIALLTFLGEVEQVGNNAALALLTALYSLMINVIVIAPFRSAINKKLADIPV